MESMIRLLVIGEIGCIGMASRLAQVLGVVEGEDGQTREWVEVSVAVLTEVVVEDGEAEGWKNITSWRSR